MSTFLFWRRINHQTARYVTLRLMPDFYPSCEFASAIKTKSEMKTESKPTPVSVSRKERSSIDTCQWLEGHSESGQGELSEEGWLHSAHCCCLSDRQSALKKLRYVLRKQDNIVFGGFFHSLHSYSVLVKFSYMRTIKHIQYNAHATSSTPSPHVKFSVWIQLQWWI